MIRYIRFKVRYIQFLVWRERAYWKLVRSARRRRKLDPDFYFAITYKRPRTEYEEFSFKLTFKKEQDQ